MTPEDQSPVYLQQSLLYAAIKQALWHVKSGKRARLVHCDLPNIPDHVGSKARFLPALARLDLRKLSLLLLPTSANYL